MWWNQVHITITIQKWNTIIFGVLLAVFCFLSLFVRFFTLYPYAFDVIICAARRTSHWIPDGEQHGSSLRGKIHATYTKIVTKHWIREGDLYGFWLDASNFLVFVQFVAFSIANPNEYFVFDIRKVYKNMNSGCEFRFFFHSGFSSLFRSYCDAVKTVCNGRKGKNTAKRQRKRKK